MRGRKPSPVQILKLHGSWRANSRDSEQVFNVPPAQRIVCPKWLKGGARQHWFRLVPQLKDLGVLTELDLDLLGVYCSIFNEYLKAVDIQQNTTLIVKNTRGGYCQNPIIRTVNQLADRVVSIGSEFGLSPAARAGMGRRGHREPFEKNGIEKYIGYEKNLNSERS